MGESPTAYIQRILQYAEGHEPLDVLAATPARLMRLVAGVEESRLARPPAPGKWSVREILAHLADVELVMGYRVRLILQTDGVEIQAFDQDRWAAIGRYAATAPAHSLERLRIEREANVMLLRSLTPAQRSRHGVHVERGRETIGRIQQLWAGHDINHARQVEGLLV